MELSASQFRDLVVMLVTSCVAMALVFSLASLSIILVFSVRSCLQAMIHFITLLCEICVAVIAALTSGLTVSITVVLATGAASLTFPASSLHARVFLSMLIGGGSTLGSALALTWFSSLRLHVEIAAAVTSTAAISVAIASAWATGVLSLVEKETQQAGLRVTSILDASRNNNYRLLYVLIKLHFAIKQGDLNTALIQAIKCGHLDSTTVLLTNGADPNTKDSYENTPLAIACEMGMYDIASLLISHGACVNAQTGNKSTPLHGASKWGYQDCIHLLISHNASVNAQDCLWRTPLMLAAKYASHPEDILMSLLAAGASVNLIGCESRTVLHYAASRGKGVEFLLDRGASANVKDRDGNTPLHYAAAEGHPGVILELLRYSGDVNTYNSQNRTPLHLAAIGGNAICVEYLVNAGADAVKVDTIGYMPMYYAACYGHVKVIGYFLLINSPLKGFKTHEMSPLYIALENRHFEIARLLLIGGSDCKVFHDWFLHQPIDIQDRYARQLSVIQQVTCTPFKLSHLCRIVIRSNICQFDSVDSLQLPLPKVLKEYITMADLVKGFEDTSNVKRTVKYRSPRLL